MRQIVNVVIILILLAAIFATGYQMGKDDGYNQAMRDNIRISIN